MPTNRVDFSTMTAGSSASTLATACSPVMPSQTKGAIITIENDQIRWRDDGTAPTSTEGHLRSAGAIMTFDSWTSGQDWKQVFRAIQFIRVTNDAKLKISWYD